MDLISGICVGRWGAEEERFMFFTAEVLSGKKSQGKIVGEEEKEKNLPAAPSCLTC